MRRFALLLGLATLPALLPAAAEYPRMGPDIFDPQAPAEDLIEAALARAVTEHKRVLLFFGANWCPWCRRLHRVFTTDDSVAALLDRGFVLVNVDANMRRDRKRNAAVIARYGHPLRFGLPVFVVLDSDGAQRTTRETQSFAAPTDDEVGRRVSGFLRHWLPPAS